MRNNLFCEYINFVEWLETSSDLDYSTRVLPLGNNNNNTRPDFFFLTLPFSDFLLVQILKEYITRRGRCLLLGVTLRRPITDAYGSCLFNQAPSPMYVQADGPLLNDMQS